MKHIFIYGPPGSGKSTVGEVLAQSLNLPFVDLDTEIELATGQAIPQIMGERGESTFRDLESEMLSHAANKSPSLIALGGGSLLREQNRHRVGERGIVIFLDAEAKTLIARLQKGESRRPLLEGDQPRRLRSLLAQREAHYKSFTTRVNVDDQSPAQIVWEIQKRIGRFHVRGMGADYDVLAEPGAMDQLADFLKTFDIQGRIVLVSDSNVAPIYSECVLKSFRAAGYDANLTVIPAGEKHKTLETVSTLWNDFLGHGLDRQSLVVALGGGVIGDLAGFAASTFMRGVNWVSAPTTLLAMVDASLGGKTGFDLPQGKNLIGAFHAPRLVLADPNVLSTLDESELRSGLAEVVKHGVIADPELFELCARGVEAIKADLTQLVRRAMAVKIEIIQQDPFEKGLRTALNLGHTLGHALETASNYRLRHGEAVAIGMAVEAQLAERLGVAEAGLSDRIASVLTDLGLPTKIPIDISVQSILDSMRLDKKKSGSLARFALPVRIGEVKVGVPVEDLEAVFAETR